MFSWFTYNFFKGLSGGVLTFSSIIEDETSSSVLIIDNFKVVNAPGVVKLLSLADFGGLADLAEGDGLSFEKMEIKMSIDRGFLKLNELYAVGPSISVLMEGYKEENGLTSLRGTLVPAKNLNKLTETIKEQEKQLSSFLSTQLNTQTSMLQLTSKLSQEGVMDSESKKHLKNLDSGIQKLIVSIKKIK